MKTTTAPFADKILTGEEVDWVWLVEPECRQVLVYHSPTDLTTLDEHDTLEGEGALAGFSLSLAELFAV